MSVANIEKLQENTATLCKMATKLSGWALSEDPDMSNRESWNALLSHPASGAGCEISGWNVGGAEFRMWDIRVECRLSRIPDVRHPGGMSAEQNSECETSGWNVGGAKFRMCLWQRTSKLRFFIFLSFPLLCHGFQRTLLNLGLLWWSKSYQNTKT